MAAATARPRAVVAGGADGGPLTGLLVTVAATADDLEQATPDVPAGGLVLSLTLENRSGRDAAGVRISAPAPARVRVTHTSQPRGTSSLSGAPAGPGTGAGSQSQAVTWAGIDVRAGERLGPFGYRIVPAGGADGAAIFRDAIWVPRVTWAQPGAGAAVPALRLNGLWGEGGLRRTVLPGGLTVFTRERPDTATVSLMVGVRAGSRDEDDTTSGGSHWLEHAFHLGTTTRPTAQVIDNAISNVGGQTNAGTGLEYTNYWKLVPADQFDLALDVLADQLLNSTFPGEAFERERRVVFEELKLRNDTPGTRAIDEFTRLVFSVSPLRRDPGGTIESVQSIPIDVILAHKDRRYVTGNMAVAAIGNLRHDEAVAKIEQAFAGLPRGPRTTRPAVPEPVQTAPRRLEIGEGTRASEIRLGWPAPPDLGPDNSAMHILNDILGATGRRLTEEIRDRRALATAVGPGYIDASDAGAFLISASTAPAREAQVVELILAEVRRLRDGAVTDEEVETSLRAIAGRRALGEEANQSQAGRAVAEVVGTLESYEEFLTRLRSVQPADVQRVARTYLDPANYTLVIVRS